jgi:hypothetical protein
LNLNLQAIPKDLNLKSACLHYTALLEDKLQQFRQRGIIFIDKFYIKNGRATTILISTHSSEGCTSLAFTRWTTSPTTFYLKINIIFKDKK